jgi:hypothetical protein
VNELAGLPSDQAHPMLDPRFFERDPASARALARGYVQMSRGDDDYNTALNRLLNPFERPRSLAENLEATRRYLVDVNAYLAEVLDLIPHDMRKFLAMDAEVAALNDTLGLLDLAFRGDGARVRFEAQRKLYLAKLLFDIDHDPGVQMGPLHKKYFEDLLVKAFWSKATRVKPIDLFFELADDGMHITTRTRRARFDDEKWSFHLARVRWPGRRPIHVYHYGCRFKREMAPFQYTSGEAEYRIEERPIWETLHERRSGSILSKMIRKGEVHPRKIQDIIGAMFIVKDEPEVETLQDTLYDIFGGPLHWKDRVNTIHFPEERTLLNSYSGDGYEVLKSDVDVVYAPAGGNQRPYIFSVEVQIYTIEGFLRTVHSRHYASHQRLKLRQFLEALLPRLFPVSVYGEKTILNCLRRLEETVSV